MMLLPREPRLFYDVYLLRALMLFHFTHEPPMPRRFTLMRGAAAAFAHFSP